MIFLIFFDAVENFCILITSSFNENGGFVSSDTKKTKSKSKRGYFFHINFLIDHIVHFFSCEVNPLWYLDIAEQGLPKRSKIPYLWRISRGIQSCKLEILLSPPIRRKISKKKNILQISQWNLVFSIAPNRYGPGGLNGVLCSWFTPLVCKNSHRL